MSTSQPLHHALSAYQAWKKVAETQTNHTPVLLDGFRLDIPTVVAVARARHSDPTKVIIDPDPKVRERLEQSVAALTSYLEKQWTVYGVNTGFGGSADARTHQLNQLQVSCLQHTQSGIVTSRDKGLISQEDDYDDQYPHVFQNSWVRGAILVRANQNMRGHSAIRLDVLQRLLDLLEKNILPLIPLRGTISASGDLMPLSYIAGTITGNPDIFVRCRQHGNLRLGKATAETATMTAAAALRLHNLAPITLHPKEGLGLINGTAPSTALASLVLFDAQNLALLAQVVTAFTAECLEGNVDWSHEFIHRIRPHQGQVEAAANIRNFLQGSHFVSGLEEKKRAANGLWQDRYSTRTAPQWIGPYLEDLMLARQQVETELNSTSDNPLVQALPGDSAGKVEGEVYSGGNFQATALTSAMDKARMAIVMIGRMLFSQVTEMINPATNNGLDANLVWGDQDRSFTMKGIDVNAAAYMAELASLAHPVSSHVQSAEMGNQGINSMAFVSARRTLEAIDLFSHLMAAELYVCCQAIELRAAHRHFLGQLREEAQLNALTGGLTLPDGATETIISAIKASWMQENTTPWEERCAKAADAVIAPLLALSAAKQNTGSDNILLVLPQIRQAVYQALRSNLKAFATTTDGNMTAPPLSSAYIESMLGAGSRPLYAFVRRDLAVPPSFGLADALLSTETEPIKTIGSGVGAIYESIRSGRLFQKALMTPQLEAMLSPAAKPRVSKL